MRRRKGLGGGGCGCLCVGGSIKFWKILGLAARDEIYFTILNIVPKFATMRTAASPSSMATVRGSVAICLWRVRYCVFELRHRACRRVERSGADGAARGSGAFALTLYFVQTPNWVLSY